MSWVGDPGPKGYSGPEGYTWSAETARQIERDLTGYFNNLNERIYMLEEQAKIQRNLTAELYRTISGIKADYKKPMNNEMLRTSSSEV